MSVGTSSKTMSRNELGIQASALVHAMQRIKQAAPAHSALRTAKNALLIVMVPVATKMVLRSYTKNVRLGVNRVTLTARRDLLLFPDQRTSLTGRARSE